jgi:hypothetical protein
MSASVRYGFSIDRVGSGAPIALRDGKRAPRAIGNVPRVARLVALAHRFAGQLRGGRVANMAELAARLGITRPRMTQIMNMLLLAPDIQEELLFLPPTVRGRDPVTLRTMGYVSATPIWAEQRERWREIKEAG